MPYCNTQVQGASRGRVAAGASVGATVAVAVVCAVVDGGSGYSLKLIIGELVLSVERERVLAMWAWRTYDRLPSNQDSERTIVYM